MKSIEEIKQNKNLRIQEMSSGDGYAYANLYNNKDAVMIVFSSGGGWEHVSVSYKNRCCTWEEMCKVKNMFFREDECVVQYHPAEKDYVNMHPYCLHLWKPQEHNLPTPPKFFV
ncbi:MAG: hypothetical protein ACLKAK_07190 [Alkaliphilus sp.]